MEGAFFCHTAWCVWCGCPAEFECDVCDFECCEDHAIDYGGDVHRCPICAEKEAKRVAAEEEAQRQYESRPAGVVGRYHDPRFIAWGKGERRHIVDDDSPELRAMCKRLVPAGWRTVTYTMPGCRQCEAAEAERQFWNGGR